MRGMSFGTRGRQTPAARPAIVAGNERGEGVTLSWAELKRQTASLALDLRRRGIGRGDRVAAYLAQHPRGGGRSARLRQPWRRYGPCARPTWASTRSRTVCGKRGPRR